MTGISFLIAIVKFIFFLTVESVICLSAIFIYYVNSVFDFFMITRLKQTMKYMSAFFPLFIGIQYIFPLKRRRDRLNTNTAETFIFIWN